MAEAPRLERNPVDQPKRKTHARNVAVLLVRLELRDQPFRTLHEVFMKFTVSEFFQNKMKIMKVAVQCVLGFIN